jgi:hypothetical protein
LVTTPTVLDPHLSFLSTPASTGKQPVTLAAFVITKDNHEVETTWPNPIFVDWYKLYWVWHILLSSQNHCQNYGPPFLFTDELWLPKTHARVPAPSYVTQIFGLGGLAKSQNCTYTQTTKTHRQALFLLWSYLL